VAVVLVRKFHSYDGQRPFVAWAIGIAKTEILMYRHERTRDRHIFKESLVEQIAETSERLTPLPMDGQLSRCFDGLDDRSQKVMHLRYARDLRTRQIADQMRMTDSAIRKLLSRARIAIRDCLDRAKVMRGQLDE
jgi:RNA polymerase sigma-70 factor (ECF subfamily)